MSENQKNRFGDYRRAAVLTMHHRRGNLAGVLAIVDETNAEGRGVQLLSAILSLHGTIIGRLRTKDGITLLANYVHGMATLEAAEPPGTDIRRAAQILEHHGQGDHAGIGREMAAAVSEMRATEAFVQLLDLYEVALPEVSSIGGIAWLEAQIDLLRTEEFRPDGD